MLRQKTKITVIYELSCFPVFPLGCIYFRGANPVKCYTGIWAEIGCLEDGYDYPEKLSWTKKVALNNMNLLYVTSCCFKFLA